METEDRPIRTFRPGAVVGGGVLLALGAGLLLDRSGTIGMHHLTGPIVLIVLGAAMTLEHSGFLWTIPPRVDNGDTRSRARRRQIPGGGVWLIGIGVWMLVSQNQLWGFTFETSWPLLIVFMGVVMVLRGWQ